MRRCFLVLLLGAGLVAGTAAAAPGDLPSLSDEFANAATLASWDVTQGDVQDGGPGTYAVDKGVLTIVPALGWWVDGTHAFFLSKQVSGDFKVTVRIRTSGRRSALPKANWSLAGLLLRAPTDDRANENWVGWTTGQVNGRPSFERKTTAAGRSVLRLIPARPGWVQLRAVRIGPNVALLRRYPRKPWVLQGTYARGDLPESLEVGIDAQSGYASGLADLVARADWIRFADTGVSADERAALLSGQKPIRALLPALTS